MADWASFDAERGTSTFVGVITPSATANTKGAASSVLVTLTEPSYGFWLYFDFMQSSATARTVFFDILVDGVTLFQNLAINPGGKNGASDSRCHTQGAFFPLVIPAGAVTVKAQSSMASHGDCVLTLTTRSGGMQSFGQKMATYGAITGTTRGTVVTSSGTANTFGNWVEICSSTLFRHHAIMAVVLHGNAWQTAFNEQFGELDIGTGTTTADAISIWRTSRGGMGANATTGIIHPMWHGPVMVDIPEGQKIFARTRRDFTSASQRNVDVILYGIG